MRGGEEERRRGGEEEEGANFSITLWQRRERGERWGIVLEGCSRFHDRNVSPTAKTKRFAAILEHYDLLGVNFTAWTLPEYLVYPFSESGAIWSTK
jgi:hypothetical protein